VSSRTSQPVAPWAEAASLLAGLLAPIAFHPFGTLGFEATKAVLVQVLGLILVLGWVGRRAADLRAPVERADLEGLPRPVALATLALAGYLLTHILATAVSIVPRTSLLGSYDRIQGLTTLAAWAALGVAAALAARDGERARYLVRWWLIATIPVCLYALVQRFQLDPIDWLGQPLGVTSTLGSSTALGTYLAMAVPLTIVRVWESARAILESGRRRRPGRRPSSARLLVPPAAMHVAWVDLLVLELVVLPMTTVRGALLGLVVGAGVTVTTLITSGRGRAIAVAALAVAAVATSILAVGGAVGFEDRGDVADNSTGQRLLIWRSAVGTATSSWRFVTGYGSETQMQSLEARFPVEIANRYPDIRFDRAHNVLLDTLLTSGLLGLLAFLALLATLAHAGVRALTTADDGRRQLAAGLLGALAASLVSNLFAFDSIATGTMFWLCAGLLVGGHLLEPSAPPARRASRRDREAVAPSLGAAVRLRSTAALTGVVGAGLAIQWIIGPLMADLYHTQALGLRAGEAAASSLARELEAISWAPDRDVYPLALADTYLELARATAARESATPGRFDDLFTMVPTGRDGLFIAARLALERALDLTPLDAYTHAHAARFWSTWGEATGDPAERSDRLAQAAREYDRAIELGPQRAVFYDESGLVMARLGRWDAALERYRQAEALTRRTAERVARAGDIEAERGNTSVARDRYREALELDARSAPAEHGLASLERMAGDPLAALEHAQRAARFQMRNWEYHRDLAIVYRDLGEWSEALSEARTARRLAPAWEWDELTELIESTRR
jgi:O-antigen ligase/Tfp pilus assembly protein PilF